MHAVINDRETSLGLQFLPRLHFHSYLNTLITMSTISNLLTQVADTDKEQLPRAFTVVEVSGDKLIAGLLPFGWSSTKKFKNLHLSLRKKTSQIIKWYGKTELVRHIQ